MIRCVVVIGVLSDGVVADIWHRASRRLEGEAERKYQI